MTIAQINNIFMLLGCGCVAYLLCLILQAKCWFEKPVDELNKRKEEKLTKSAYDYYYTLAINSPEILASDLAKARIRKLKKQGKINELYTKWRAC